MSNGGLNAPLGDMARYLAFRGYEVRHLVNITDLDDKTIEGSEKAGMSLEAFTGMHIDAFHHDLDVLGIRPANHYPKASEHTDDMVNLADRLVKKGFAYEKLRSIYFDISRFKAYGELSGIDLNKIRLGATVDDDDRGTLPFTLTPPSEVPSEVTVDASASSQFVTALLLVLGGDG